MDDNLNKKPRVLVVDDAEDILAFHKVMLEEDYEVYTASSGEAALDLAPQISPEVVLLDVSMEGLDGFETCRHLKQKQETEGIDVIFISSADSVQEMLKGYEVGAVNYLIKPVEENILLTQLANVIRDRSKRKVLIDSEKFATKVAMLAMENAGEQGIIIDFMRKCFTLKDRQSLADLIIDTTRFFDLQSSVQIRSGDDVINASTNGIPSALEIALLSRLKSAGRIRESGSNLVVNFNSITLLVTNLPNDEEKRGRLRDHLAMLMESAELQHKSSMTTYHLQLVLEESKAFLREMESLQKTQKESSLEIFDELVLDLEKLASDVGFTLNQENSILEITKKYIHHFMDNFDEGKKLDDSFQPITDRLNVILNLNKEKIDHSIKIDF